MKKWKEKETEELRPLEEIAGELVTLRQSMEEVQGHIRLLYFSDMTSELAAHYYDLNDRNKRLVGEFVEKLSDEHQGFNLRLYLYWFTHSDSEPKLDQLDLAKYFTIMDGGKMAKRGWNDTYAPSYIRQNILKLNNDKTIRPGSELLAALCDNILFDPELLSNGYGAVRTIKPDILQSYIDDPTVDKTTRSLKSEFTEYGKKIGKTWNEIVNTQYCVINFTYGYCLLEESKDQTQKELVDRLIEELYSQQKKYEDDLRTQQQKHAEEIQALYMHILQNGGVSEYDESMDQ